MERVRPLHPILYEGLVRRALRDDLGRAGDITTDYVVSQTVTAKARILVRAAGCVAGLEVAAQVFRLLDSSTEITLEAEDGDEMAAGATVARLQGSARTLLQGERTALNFLGHLSGIATATRDIVKQIKPSTRVLCTRKTTPGLGPLEKYAVRVGGGFNHRLGLDDAVLIKENHLALVGDLGEAVRRARKRAGHMVNIEVEVESLQQLAEALEQDVDAVLLDNMSLDEVREAVRLADGKVLVEASGGLTPAKALQMAEIGVDLLSMGWLTHSAPALDVALEIEIS